MGLKEETQERMEIVKKGLGGWHNLSRANASFEEYKINDKDFDKKIKVKSTKDSFAKKILSSTSLKQGIKEIATQQMKFSAGWNTLKFMEQGYMMDSAYLSGVLEVLDELRNEINHYSRYAPKKETLPDGHTPYPHRNSAHIAKRQGKQIREKGKEKNKILWIIIFFLVAFFVSIFFITAINNGTAGNLFLNIAIFLGIIFALFIASAWDSIPGTRHYKSQRAVKELNTLLRKELLPLGFREERDIRFPLQGFSNRDILINAYENKPKKFLHFSVIEITKTPYYTLISVEKHFRKEEEFMGETKEKFTEWLLTLEDETKENSKGKLGHLDLL